MEKLNELALIYGWIFLVFIGVVIAALVVVAAWSWFTEQLWRAGERVRRRRAKDALND